MAGVGGSVIVDDVGNALAVALSTDPRLLASLVKITYVPSMRQLFLYQASIEGGAKLYWTLAANLHSERLVIGIQTKNGFIARHAGRYDNPNTDMVEFIIGLIAEHYPEIMRTVKS